MLISLLFLIFGIFNLVRTVYIYQVAPRLLKQEVQYYQGGMDNKCYETTRPKPDGSNNYDTVPVDQKACDAQIEDSKKLWLESNILSSTLAIILSALVMLTHYLLMGKSVFESTKITPPTKK